MSNFIPPDALNEIKAGIAAGLSMNAIAKATGCDKRTVKRYYPETPPPCGCGAPAGHKGWCAARTARSPRRQAQLAAYKGIHIPVLEEVRRSRANEARAKFAFVFGLSDNWRYSAQRLPQAEHYGVIGEVWDATKRVIAEVRDDVRQSMVLAVYEGRLQRREIAGSVGAFAKYEMKNMIGAAWSLYLSLHAPMGNGTGFGIDLLSDESCLDEDGTWRPTSLAA